MEKKIVPTSRLCHKGVGSRSGKCSIPDMLAEPGKLGRRHKGSRRRRYPQERLGMRFRQWHGGPLLTG